MALEFLSKEWAAEMADAVNNHDGFSDTVGEIAITVQNVVTDGPNGECRYYVGIADGAAFCEVGETDNADITIDQEYAVAVRLAKGELDLQSALMQGHIRASGNLALALQHREQLEIIQVAIGQVEVDY